MSKNTLSVLFLIRKTRLLKTGEAPIQMRITCNGRYIEMHTQRQIAPSEWDQRKERAKGKSPAAQETNRYLEFLRTRGEVDRALDNYIFSLSRVRQNSRTGKDVLFVALLTAVDEISTGLIILPMLKIDTEHLLWVLSISITTVTSLAMVSSWLAGKIRITDIVRDVC